MSHHHYVILALIGGIAVGYLAVSTLSQYPVYSTVYGLGASFSNT